MSNTNLNNNWFEPVYLTSITFWCAGFFVNMYRYCPDRWASINAICMWFICMFMYRLYRNALHEMKSYEKGMANALDVIANLTSDKECYE